MSGNSSAASDDDDLEMLRSAALKTLKSRQFSEENKQVSSQVNASSNGSADSDDNDDNDELDAKVSDANRGADSPPRPSSVDLLISEIENELEKLNAPIELKYEHIENSVEQKSQSSESETQGSQREQMNGNEAEKGSEQQTAPQAVSDVEKTVGKKTDENGRRSRSRSRSASKSATPDYRRASTRRSLSRLQSRRTSGRATKQRRQKVPIVVNPISLRPLSPRSAAFVSANREIVARRIRSHSSSRSRSRTRSLSRSQSPVTSQSSVSRSSTRSRSKSQPRTRSRSHSRSRRSHYGKQIVSYRLRSPAALQTTRSRTGAHSENVSVTSTARTDRVMEERRRRFRHSPVPATAQKIIKLEQRERPDTKKADASGAPPSSPQTSARKPGDDASATTLDILLSDEDDDIFKVEENEARFKSSASTRTARAAAAAAAAKAHVVSASLPQMHRPCRSVTVTSRATNTCAAAGAVSDPVSDHINRRNILLPPKKTASIVAQVKPIKKPVRKHTPIVFKSDEASEPKLKAKLKLKQTPAAIAQSTAVAASAPVTFPVLRRAPLASSVLNPVESNPKSSSQMRTAASSASVPAVRNVKKIADSIDSEANVIDLRLELKRKRAVKLNRLLDRNAPNVCSEASSSLGDINGRDLGLLKGITLKSNRKLPVQMRLGKMTKITQV